MTDPKQPPTPPSGGGPPPPKEPPPPKPPAAQTAPPAKPGPTDPVESLALEALQRKFPEAVREVSYYAGEVNVLLKKERLVESCRYLKESPELRMDYLSNLCGVDYPDREERFEVVYHLFSTSLNHRINLKVRVAEGEPAPSVTGVWRTANWHEREAFDLLGIPFEGHPDLRRILMGDDFQGHPLRKEYPIRGYDKDHLKLR